MAPRWARLRILTLPLLGVFISACQASGSEDVRKIEGITLRATAPNGVVEAIAATSNAGGATVPTITRVYLHTPASIKAYETIRAIRVDGLDVHWVEDAVLVISMRCGNVLQFSNFFDVVDSEGDIREIVSVRLQSPGPCADASSAR
jgi:hypothetical protein